MQLLGSCASQGVAMHFPKCSEWHLVCCYVVSIVFCVLGGCQGVAMQLQRCSKSFLICCYAVARVFWESAKEEFAKVF